MPLGKTRKDNNNNFFVFGIKNQVYFSNNDKFQSYMVWISVWYIDVFLTGYMIPGPRQPVSNDNEKILLISQRTRTLLRDAVECNTQETYRWTVWFGLFGFMAYQPL